MGGARVFGLTCSSFAVALLSIALTERRSEAVVDAPLAEVWAVVGDNRVPVDVGSIVTTGSLVDDKCEFIESFGVEVLVPEGGLPLEVEWMVQDGCQVVIHKIGPAAEVPGRIYLNPPDLEIPVFGGTH